MSLADRQGEEATKRLLHQLHSPIFGVEVLALVLKIISHIKLVCRRLTKCKFVKRKFTKSVLTFPREGILKQEMNF